MSRPDFHAALNLVAAVLLSLGWLAIKGRGPWSSRQGTQGARGAKGVAGAEGAADERRIDVHRRLMLGAFGVSTVFLASYLEYHLRVGSVPYRGTGWLKALYFTVLIPHVVLAAVMVPLILVTLTLALGARLPAHRAWARWTLPIWLFVSVTGVIVWLMLYPLHPR